MNFDPHRWQPAPLLFAGASRQRFRLASLTAVALLISLVGMSGTAAWRTHPLHLGHPTGEITVITQGAGLESSDAAAARAVEILVAIKGVSHIRVRDSENPTAPGWPPRSIDLVIPGTDPVLIKTIATELKAEGIAAEIDDHGPLTGHLERTIGLILAVTTVVGALLAVLAGRLITFWPGLRLASSKGVIDIMHHYGADRWSYLREVKRGFTLPVLIASVLGATLAATGWLVLTTRGPAPEALAGITAAPVDMIAALP